MKYLSKSVIKQKTVLLRTSLDVPLGDKTGEVADDFRLLSGLASVHLLRKQGHKVIICGKLGRPEGEVVKGLSLRPVAVRMAKLLDLHFAETKYKLPTDGLPHLIFFTGDLMDEKNREQLTKVSSQDLVVLENMEFYAEELKCSKSFGKKLASLADLYVNDDFAKCHHPVASLVTVAEYLPSFAGLQLEKELIGLNKVLKNPTSPFVVMMGGIKITDKVKTLEHLGKKADKILLAGGLANLFYKAKGFEVGKSKIEPEAEQLAWTLEKNFKNKLLLPEDVVVAKEGLSKKTIRCCKPYEVTSQEYILDIGPLTMLAFAKVLKSAKTIVWNGPLGHFEVKPFHHGTMALARIIGGVAQSRGFAVVGGGETVDAIRQAGQEDMLDLLSTGGGAMLEYLSGDKLPGLEALG